jgi:DNA primase
VKLPDSFLEELRARTPLPALIGRRVKLSRSGRNWKACCPFHGEKTPSFYTYDDHYHCFGCGAHGDAIGFVMQSQGASFMEAVEALASEAGLDLPKPSREAEEAERQRLDLHGVLQEAARFYQTQLFAPGGGAALAYLRGRGLSDETIVRFGLGWSGEGRGALLRHLAADEVTPERLMQAGLLREDEDGAPRGEFFFNRVMFPIRDRRGRVVSFGGRAMGDGQPKYLNGPETALFSKRRTLYGLDLAKAAPKTAPIIAVEGYMDVITLHQAGFPGAVAPLGTALTEEQLEELWRLSPVPVLCFDGDAAGARAAERAADICLPFIAADRTIRIATLPDGEDPDTLIRRQGAAGFTSFLDAARSLSVALFDIKRSRTGDKTPEQKAMLRKSLSAAIAAIPDKALRTEYDLAFRDRLFVGRRAQKPKPVFVRPAQNAALPTAQRHAIMLAIAAAHPAMLSQVEEKLHDLLLPPHLAALREAIFTWAETAPALDLQALTDHLTRLGMKSGLDGLLALVPADITAQRAQVGWWHFYGLTNRQDLEHQLKLAEMAHIADPSEANFRRHDALAQAWLALKRGGVGADDDDDVQD